MKKDSTEEMLKHFRGEWDKADFSVVLPQNIKIPNIKWFQIKRDDIQITKYKRHEKSEEWELLIHKLFRFSVIKNRRVGFHIEQLQFQNI